MPSLKTIHQPPSFVTPEQHALNQQSTPSSFAALPPVLRLLLENVTVYINPTPTDASSCFTKVELPATQSMVEEPDQDQNEQDEVENQALSMAQGSLWLTESELAFLSPSTSTGFSLSYPSISLHAVTRSPPKGLTGPSTSSALNGEGPSFGCLYCQLDLSADNQDVEEDDQDSLLELHIFTADQDSLDQLFDAMSQCASLHPSAGGGDDSHPLSGFAPFGSGAADSITMDGTFDDADEADDSTTDAAENGNGDEQQLSETGRVRNDFQTPDSRYRPY